MKIIIFGSTGDLVKRKVIPALSEINENLEILALGRKELTTEEYKKNLNIKLKHKLEYKKIDVENITAKELITFLDKEEKLFFYIALPPKMIKNILDALSKLKKQGFNSKILIEKPFGNTLKEALELKELIIKEDLEKEIFIADHYLFKEEIINHEKAEFKNIMLVSLEKVGLENRITYYDEVGAIKDMIQSHFLNILFKFIKNPEKEFYKFEIKNYKLGQYGNGQNIGYTKELGKPSKTETFVSITLKTKNHEFKMITGKKFNKKLSFIEVDTKRKLLEDLVNPYKKMFLDFLKENKLNFTTIDNSILAWKIIEKIEQEKPELEYYKENKEPEKFIQ